MRVANVFGNSLYQGGVKTLQGHRLPDQVAALERAGITTVANVCPYEDELVDYFEHYRLPFADSKKALADVDPILELAGKLAGRVRDGGRVLTLCHQGRNRSGFVNALVIRELLNCDGWEALTRLRKVRRGACGGNRFFEEFLRGLPCPR